MVVSHYPSIPPIAFKKITKCLVILVVLGILVVHKPFFLNGNNDNLFLGAYLLAILVLSQKSNEADFQIKVRECYSKLWILKNPFVAVNVRLTLQNVSTSGGLQ